MKLHDVRDCFQITGEAGCAEEAQAAVGCPGHNPVMTVSLFLQMFKIFHNKKRVVVVFFFTTSFNLSGTSNCNKSFALVSYI